MSIGRPTGAKAMPLPPENRVYETAVSFPDLLRGRA
jgi:hypothetical protein